MKKSLFVALLLGTSSIAFAEPKITVSPAAIHPGDPVLVTVTGTTEPPQGKAGGQPLVFFAAKTGYQAVFAAPLAINEDHILVEFSGGPKPVSVAVTAKTFPETKLVVEEELANPDKADREKIDADNKAITEAYEKGNHAPQFTHAFKRPPGSVTSVFGEWRTFNDGHRSQHLGLDLGAREGSKVSAVEDTGRWRRCRQVRYRDRPCRSHRSDDRPPPPHQHARRRRDGRSSRVLQAGDRAREGDYRCEVRSRVMFFWCASIVPPPISINFASRRNCSTRNSEQ